HCIVGVWLHGSVLRPSSCPVCRRPITLLVPSKVASVLSSLVARNSRQCTNPPYAFLKTTTIPTYYGIFIAMPRYIAMQPPLFRLMTCA
ncbi:hypothetical protein ZWY2020_032581, partial [Hordeum vulgare]